MRYIRDNPDNLSRKELAEKFGLHPAAISYIQTGKTYQNAGGTIRESNSHPMKTTTEQRAQIRADYATGNFTYAQLAQIYGCCTATICNIINGRD